MSTAPIQRIYSATIPLHASTMLAGRIAKNIEQLRVDRGWSRPQLGLRCVPPTSGQQIERLEKGDRRLTIDWLERIARGFQVDPSVLIAGDNQRFMLTEQVADVVALTMGRIALGGAEPDPEIVRNLALMIQELSETFESHPSARRDPEVVRPVIDLLAKQRGRQ